MPLMALQEPRPVQGLHMPAFYGPRLLSRLYGPFGGLRQFFLGCCPPIGSLGIPGIPKDPKGSQGIPGGLFCNTLNKFALFWPGLSFQGQVVTRSVTIDPFLLFFIQKQIIKCSKTRPIQGSQGTASWVLIRPLRVL